MAEKKYVEVESLKERFRHINVIGRDGIMQRIDEHPAADVVEVVRCRDCGYFYQDENLSFCDHPCEDMVDRLPTDFCSRGIRKEDA